MPDEAMARAKSLAAMSEKQGPYATSAKSDPEVETGKRSRTGEAIHMSTDFVRTGPLDPTVVKKWIRVAVLAKVKDMSDTQYGNAISLNSYIQKRRTQIGLVNTVAQERTLRAAEERAEKALEKVKLEQQRLAERELRAQQKAQKALAKQSKKSGSSGSGVSVS